MEGDPEFMMGAMGGMGGIMGMGGMGGMGAMGGMMSNLHMMGLGGFEMGMGRRGRDKRGDGKKKQ